MRAALVGAAVALWMAASWPAVARAQGITSVRQAKLVTTDANGNPLLNDIAVATSPTGSSSRSFDTTAFAAAIVTVQATAGGVSCGTDMLLSPMVEIPGIYGWVRLDYAWDSGTGRLTISLSSATSQGGQFLAVFLPLSNNYYESVPIGCVFDASLTLVPFATSIVTNGATNEGKTVTQVSLAPNVIGGIDPASLGGLRATIRTAGVTADHEVLVTGDVTPVTPVLATEDPIIPNSITTTETVYTFDGTKRLTLQANGTGYVWCRVTTDNTLVITASNYTIALAAATAANDGTGGSITLPYVPASGTYLRCIAGTGTAIVNGFAHP